MKRLRGRRIILTTPLASPFIFGSDVFAESSIGRGKFHFGSESRTSQRNLKSLRLLLAYLNFLNFGLCISSSMFAPDFYIK